MKLSNRPMVLGDEFSNMQSFIKYLSNIEKSEYIKSTKLLIQLVKWLDGFTLFFYCTDYLCSRRY